MNDLPEVFLFDLDGTLVDSFQAIADSTNFVRGKNDLPPLSVQEVRSFVGRGLRKLVERAIPAGDLDANCALFSDHHPTVLLEGTQLLPGVLETLEELNRLDKRVGLCSNKPLALTTKLLDLLHIDHLFHVVYGPEKCARPKPAPDMLLAALAELNASASQALYVGDMNIDIETARAARVPVWAVATGSQTKEELWAAKPDRVLTDMTQLLDALLSKRPVAATNEI